MSYSHVLTIILPSDYTEDLKTVIETFSNHMTRMNCQSFKSAILSPTCAFDLYFTDQLIGDHQLTDILSGLCENLTGFDWFIQPTATRQKKMLVADMDSTMITIECIDELADYAGIKEKVAEITERAMQGEIDFPEALRERVALLSGMSADVLDACYKERVRFSDGAYELVQTMKRDGAVTALVSGGFTYFTEKVSDYLGFQLHRANILEITNGQLTGCVIPPISDSRTKIDTLNELAEKHGLSKETILAVGDGANDIPMIEGAGVGVAFKAKEKARAAADFSVTNTDLKALLFIQGYKEEDIVQPPRLALL